MTAFASFTLPPDATKLRFKEPFVSEAANLKDAGIIPPGIFRGFTPSPQPNFLLNFNVDVNSNDSVAAVETVQNYNLTVRTLSQIVLDLTGQVIFPVFVVLRTTYGITPTPLAGFTTSQILVVKPTLNNADPQSLNTGDIKLCKVLGFIGTVPNISVIVPSERQDNGGPLLTQAASYKGLTTLEAENATGVITVVTAPFVGWVAVPSTLINLTLSEPHNVLLRGFGTFQDAGVNGFNGQLGVFVDGGFVYPGTPASWDSIYVRHGAGVVVDKSLLISAGLHSVQLAIRLFLYPGGQPVIHLANSLQAPTRLIVAY